MLGMAMRHARRHVYFSISDIARFLRISDLDLSKYESGTAEIPMPVLQHIITMGYTLMRTREIQHEYWRMRKIMARENIPYGE